MKTFYTLKYSKFKQYTIGILLIITISSSCFAIVDIIGNKVVALLLLVAVSLLAMLFDIYPVLISALLSALIWNFFFIPPLYTFHIHNAEDLLMFLMYFAVALVNAVLTFKIRIEEKKARDKEEKEKTIKLYNTLLNSLSHELRTPIATIIGAVDTLKENREKISLKNQNDLLYEIDKASIRLNNQVENLLNMSRLETGMLKLHFDWCDINELVFSAIQKTFTQETTQKIIFDLQENLPLFKIDSGLMEQVLGNIIQNSILYTPNDSTIKISADLFDDNLKIIIEDNGMGFPENEINYVFDKFYRLPQSRAGGTGLGLSIVKGFIKAHNGTIKLENLVTGGCRFTFIIPCETSYINHLNNE